jgi:Tfp pilus assembly protein PilN
MATTLMPLDPATTPQRAQRLLPIVADLLPAEIVATRRAKAVRLRVIVVLAAVTLLLGGWYAFAVIQQGIAQTELDNAQTAKIVAESRQREYAPLNNTKRESKEISDRLTTLLANDLRWADLFNTLRSSAGGGVTITGVSGALAASDTASGTEQTSKLPSTGTAKSVGALTVTGTASDKPAVAQYVDALAQREQFANAFLTSVSTTGGGGVQFTLQVDITDKALGGRFSAKAGGK